MKTKILLSIVIFASSCFAIITNINSGATYSIMQNAVAAADSGDTLLVSTGQYTYMQVVDKNLTILGGWTPDFSVQVSYDETILDGISYCASFTHSTSLVEGITFTGANYGMSVYNQSIVTAKHCKVENNISPYQGAGVRVFGNGTLVLEYTDIENNSATNTNGAGDGGGAYVSGATLIIDNYSHVKNNFAKEKGGGIYIADSGKVVVKWHSSIYGNSADEIGGGVYLSDSQLYMEEGATIGNVTAVPNSSPGNGGGIYAKDSFIYFQDSTTLANSCSGYNGGGAYITNTTMIFDHSNLGSSYITYGRTNCAAHYGGGIYTIDSTLSISNAKIHSSYAALHGGGIFASSSDVTLYNCDIGHTNDINTNVSGSDGAAVYVNESLLTISESEFFNNHAGDDGGAIRINESLVTITNSVFKNNYADDRGGVIYSIESNAKSVLDVIDCCIVTNVAGGDGGGIYWRGASNLSVRSSIINANETGDDGGAIFVRNSAGALIDDVEILYNKAENDGGAIVIDDQLDIDLIDCDIRLNTADSTGVLNGDGGGLYIIGTSQVKIAAETKHAYVGANKAVNGASIFVDHDAVVDLVSTSGYQLFFISNVASEDGGVIFTEEIATISLLGNISILQNRADNGGAIYAAGKATILLTESEGGRPKITKCQARVSGGAIYLIDSNTTVICNGVDIYENSSFGTGYSDGGGAVGVFDEAVFIVTNCVFNKNASRYDGGAIYISNATALIYSDVSGGVAGPLPPTVFINNLATNDVNYGGAVYLTAAGVAEFYNVAFVSNRAVRGGAVYANQFSKLRCVNSLIAHNYVSQSLKAGGGIKLDSATALFEFCTIANNYRSGVEAEGLGAKLAMTNSIVYNHQIINVTTNPHQDVVYSDIQNGYPGIGNISEPPLFVSFPDVNYKLTAGSPCTNKAVDIGINIDCIGLARPQLGGYDIGAYEFVPEGGLVFSILCSVFSIFIYRRGFHFSL